MKLTSKRALEILNSSKGMGEDNNWIKHSICVGNMAAILARKLKLDVDYAKTLGYIHDIGKRFDWNKSHTLSGYEYILKLGYGEEFASVCLTHSYLNNDINCVAGGIPNSNSDKYEFKKEYIKNHEYTIYEKIINLADLMCTYKINTIEQRLQDLNTRKGVHENTKYHKEETYKLKKYFADLLGFDLYNLFPEIENDSTSLMKTSSKSH